MRFLARFPRDTLFLKLQEYNHIVALPIFTAFQKVTIYLQKSLRENFEKLSSQTFVKEFFKQLEVFKKEERINKNIIGEIANEQDLKILEKAVRNSALRSKAVNKLEEIYKQKF